MKKRILGMAATVLLTGVAITTAAQAKDVVVGVLYPLTGPVAQVGKDAVAAVRTAIQIINGSYDLDMPLAKGKGLTGLGGAKISIIVGDHAQNKLF